MAKPHERVFALIAALLFFVSSVGVSIFVILQMRSERQISRDTESATSATLDQASQEALNNTQETNMIEGTKLQNFTPIAKVDKLQAQDIVVGTGEVVKEG